MQILHTKTTKNMAAIIKHERPTTFEYLLNEVFKAG